VKTLCALCGYNIRCNPCHLCAMFFTRASCKNAFSALGLQKNELTKILRKYANRPAIFTS
jgi:hypothetical protein